MGLLPENINHRLPLDVPKTTNEVSKMLQNRGIQLPPDSVQQVVEKFSEAKVTTYVPILAFRNLLEMSINETIPPPRLPETNEFSPNQT